MNRFACLMFLLINLLSCSASEKTNEFDLAQAKVIWNTADKSWSENELKSLEQGRAVYKKSCAACHGKEGKGNLTIGAPSLVNNAILKGDISDHIALIKKGKNQMPAFAEIFTDVEVSNVAAYERNAWGNHDYQVFNGAEYY